jgi:O-antigen ligase
MMMSGAFWAVFCLKQFASSKQYWLIILPSCLIIFLAMAMTGGRTGYATWAILGLVFIVFKWRKYLLVIPLLVLIIPIVAPSAIDRLTEGFSPDEALDSRDADFQEDGVDLHLITSGRIFLWPLVIESIEDAPLFGHGRNSTQNEGITLRIIQDYGKGEVFPHPHNAYLEWMQDNGYIGALPVFLFYILILKYSWSLFRDNTNNLYVVTGGAALALLGAFLIASMGSQTFYPREGAVGMWAIIGIVLRVHIERKKVLKGIESSLLDK